MDPISILLGVVFPILLSAGLALALASVSHTAYWIAKVCFCVAALDLAGLTVWWLYTTESVAWKTMVGAALGLIIVATLPEVLRWVDRNEAAVVSERAKRLDQQFADLGPIIEALRQNQRALAASDHTKKLAAALLKSFDNLQRAIQQREKLTGTKDIENRLAVAQHIIDELKVILQNVHTFETSQGKGLIINTAPNTFHVTFPVPMRTPPNLTFPDLPPGSTPDVSDKTNIGFTVIFRPTNIRVDVFHFTASAEL
ncbi:MAG: hypothetical protein WBF58_00810 [Xanthobacteraceae bacterium]